MSTLHELARALALPLLMLASSPAVVQARESTTHALDARQIYTYERAVDAFKGERYAAAYSRFIELADAGHPASARMALMMVRSGPTLFGTTWQASPEQLARWETLVSGGLGAGLIASRSASR